MPFDPGLTAEGIEDYVDTLLCCRLHGCTLPSSLTTEETCKDTGCNWLSFIVLCRLLGLSLLRALDKASHLHQRVHRHLRVSSSQGCINWFLMLLLRIQQRCSYCIPAGLHLENALLEANWISGVEHSRGSQLKKQIA